jgi:hypothetical protein
VQQSLSRSDGSLSTMSLKGECRRVSMEREGESVADSITPPCAQATLPTLPHVSRRERRRQQERQSRYQTGTRTWLTAKSRRSGAPRWLHASLELTAQPAADSKARQDFIGSIPRTTVAPDDAPGLPLRDGDWPIPACRRTSLLVGGSEAKQRHRSDALARLKGERLNPGWTPGGYERNPYGETWLLHGASRADFLFRRLYNQVASRNRQISG